jgi:hypothetical protein
MRYTAVPLHEGDEPGHRDEGGDAHPVGEDASVLLVAVEVSDDRRGAQAQAKLYKSRLFLTDTPKSSHPPYATSSFSRAS